MSRNRIKKIVIFYLLFLCFGKILISQETDINYLIKWIDDSSGLPQNSVKSIIKDKYGYLWLLTEKGIVKYDGINFKTYDSNSFPAIKNNRMRYFIGDVESDSIIVENELNEFFIIKERKVHAINTDVLNLNSVKKFPYTLIKFSKIPSLRYKDLFYGIKGEITIDKYTIVRPDTTYIFNRNNEILNAIPYSLSEINYYFSLEERLFVINEKNECYEFKESIIKTETDLNPNEEIKLYWNSISNQTFVFTNKNLQILYLENDQIKRKTIFENLEIDLSTISNFYYDEDFDILYLASSTKGLGIVKKKNFKTFLVEDGKSNNVFYGLTNYDEKNIITSSGHLINNDGVNYKESFKFDSDQYLILFDDNKDIWVKKYQILKRYFKSTNYTTYQEWNLNTTINSLSFDKSGNIVFSIDIIRSIENYHSEIYRLNIKSEEIEPISVEKLKIKISALIHHKNDEFLLGGKDGLYKYNIETKELKTYNELVGKAIRNIQITDDGIWVFSYGYGFYLLKDDKITEIPCDKNDYLKTAHCILEDNNGYFWISSNKGIFQCSKAALLRYVENNENGLYYRYFDKNNGFNTNEFNGGGTPPGVILENGYFCFPSLDGIVFFNPNNINSNIKTHKIFVDEVIIDDSTIYVNDNEIIVDYDFDRITIFANSPFYYNKFNLNIEVEIDGPIKQKWETYNPLNGISFTSLKSGEYTLRFRQLKGFDSEYDYKTFKIIVPKKYHETIAFRTSVFLLILAFVYSLITIRLNIVKRRNIMLEKKIEESTMHLKETINILKDNQNSLVQQLNFQEKLTHLISHDVKSPLKYIENIIEKIKNNLDNKNFPVSEGLDAVQSSAKSLHEYIEQILEETKKNHQKEGFVTSNIRIYDLVNEKIKIYSSIIALNNISIKNLIPISTIVKCNPQLLSIIIHNLLDNAIKNTKQGEITFQFEKTEKGGKLIIKDTGKGMSQDMLDYLNNSANNISYSSENKIPYGKGIGLDIVISLTHYLNLKMEIKSELNKGTEVVLKLKNNSELV